MAAKKKSSSRTQAARNERRAGTRATERAKKEPQPTKEDIRKAEEARKADAEERRLAGPRLQDFLADYGQDEAGRLITDPEHSLRQAMSSDPALKDQILLRYQIHQLPYGVKEELGLGELDEITNIADAPRGGLARGESRIELSDVTAPEDDENAGVDTGVLAEQLGTGGSASSRGRVGDIETPTSRGPRSRPEMGGPITTPTRRTNVLPRLSAVRKALGIEKGEKEGIIGLPDIVEESPEGRALSAKDIGEARRLPDVPKEARWTDLGLAPTSRAITRNKVRQENVYRRIAGESAVRMALEQQRNPNKRIEIPRSFKPTNVNPAFMETAAYMAEFGGDPADWTPSTKEFFRRMGLSGIATGSTVGGSSITGADAVPRKVNTTNTGRVANPNSYVITTGTSKKYPKGAIIDVNEDVLSGQFKISNIDLATGETTERPELTIESVPGTVKEGANPVTGEMRLANPLDTTPPDPMDPNYTPYYAAVDIPIATDKDLPDSPAAKQAELARQMQKDMLTPNPATGKKGAQPWQTGVKASGSGKITEPPFGMREHGSGAGAAAQPGPDIRKMAKEAGMPDEEAVLVVRELGGYRQTMDELMDPIKESVYGTHDARRSRSLQPSQFVTQRRIQVPRASGALRKNKETGAMERDTQSYEVFLPTATQLDDYLDLLEETHGEKYARGSKAEKDLLARVDTGNGAFVKRKMTKAQKNEPMRDTSMGGKRSKKFLKDQYKRPETGPFSLKNEAELKERGARRDAEVAAIEAEQKSWKETPEQEENLEWTRAHMMGDWFGAMSPATTPSRANTPTTARSVGLPSGSGVPYAVKQLFSSKELNENPDTYKSYLSMRRSGTPMGRSRSGDVYVESPDYEQKDIYGMAFPKQSTRLTFPRSLATAVATSPQIGDIYQQATGSRLTADTSGTFVNRSGSPETYKVQVSPKVVPSVMDRAAYAEYQAKKKATAEPVAETTSTPKLAKSKKNSK